MTTYGFYRQESFSEIEFEDLVSCERIICVTKRDDGTTSAVETYSLNKNGVTQMTFHYSKESQRHKTYIMSMEFSVQDALIEINRKSENKHIYVEKIIQKLSQWYPIEIVHLLRWKEITVMAKNRKFNQVFYITPDGEIFVSQENMWDDGSKTVTTYSVLDDINHARLLKYLNSARLSYEYDVYCGDIRLPFAPYD